MPNYNRAPAFTPQQNLDLPVRSLRLFVKHPPTCRIRFNYPRTAGRSIRSIASPELR
jgi:hypothetical protein